MQTWKRIVTGHCSCNKCLRASSDSRRSVWSMPRSAGTGQTLWTTSSHTHRTAEEDQSMGQHCPMGRDRLKLRKEKTPWWTRKNSGKYYTFTLLTPHLALLSQLYCRLEFGKLFNNDKDELDEAVSFLHLQGTLLYSQAVVDEVQYQYFTFCNNCRVCRAVCNRYSVLRVYCPHAGTLLHFDDHNLKDLYFLDPQWLSKLMAHVVHIQTTNQTETRAIDGQFNPKFPKLHL